MSGSISFPSTTPNFALPLLFVGQAQKEPSINQAFSLIDGLMRGSVNASLNAPPTEAGEGSSYRVLAGATDEWTGHDGDLAIRIAGAWEFISPQDGIAVFDQSAGISLRFLGEWQTAVEPTAPTGGSTVDSEARLAISGLIDALRTAGIIGNAP